MKDTNDFIRSKKRLEAKMRRNRAYLRKLAVRDFVSDIKEGALPDVRIIKAPCRVKTCR